MFGIGGSELLLIILVVLMLFGSDKIPDIARTLGKVIKQLKHATEDIKNEIQKSAGENGLNTNDLTGGITDEIEKIKQDVTDIVKPKEIETSLTQEIEKTKEDLDQLTGPIKRQN
jgi:sec-independent protein translocase protein TatA